MRGGFGGVVSGRKYAFVVGNTRQGADEVVGEMYVNVRW